MERLLIFCAICILAMALVELIGLFIVTLSSLYIYYKFVIFNFWRKRGVFYVEPTVPTGNLTAFVKKRKQIGVLFHDVYQKYKEHRLIGMFLFYKPNLLIADPELIKMVLTKEFVSFHDRGMFCNERVEPFSGNLFCLSGNKWRNLRNKLTPTFSVGKIKQMFPILMECGEKLSKYLDSKAQMRDSVEIKDILSRYTIDVIMATAFGINSNCIEEPTNEYRIYGRKSFKPISSIRIALGMFVPQIMDFFSIPYLDRKVYRFYMNLFRENVEYRQTHNIVRKDFMNLLMQLMEKGYVDPDKEGDETTTNATSTVRKLTMTEAAAQSHFFFAAGSESSSTTITFALYELTQHQDIQDKVCKEIDEMLAKHGGLTYDAVNEMTYLHKVVYETMRKYPPLPLLNRICTKETDIPTMNLRLPKGTLISIPVLGLHRDPSIYPDPDKFDPERFNENVVAERHPYAYLPFGEGPRMCLGALFGYLQTKVALVSLLSKYKFTLHPQTQVPLNFREMSILLWVKGGVHLIIETRENNYVVT
ncbi:PREDICTED: probable cytochrome P450 6a23 isoform X2 [Vollenhovia emeryi]|uniref:probable cytochrome P450 6a23 isoform X2 n=1 Tax=Vollenhovia emeryi TaxID=411798 RepID=UPI0005F4DF6A|nr:PREDICTED: probable cytochrome P450 6a23 isoform X2 [Vollenhovia emeryi]